MIEVTRLNHTVFQVNPDMIVTLEATPDTVITLLNGEKVVVLESVDEISSRFLRYKRSLQAAEPLERV